MLDAAAKAYAKLTSAPRISVRKLGGLWTRPTAGFDS